MQSWKLKDWLSLVVGLAIGGAMFGGILMISIDGDDAETTSKFMTPLATIIVGGFASYIAHEQAKTAARQSETAGKQVAISEQNRDIAEKKLRLDHFDERYKVIAELMEIGELINKNENVHNDALARMRKLTAKIALLFNNNTVKRWHEFFAWAEDLNKKLNKIPKSAPAARLTTHKEFKEKFALIFKPLVDTTRIRHQ